MVVVSNDTGVGLSLAIGCKLCPSINVLNGIADKIGTIPDGAEPVIFSGSGFGRIATGMSTRRPVYGAAEWADQVNEYPDLGFELAVKMGMKLPEYRVETDPKKKHSLDIDPIWENITESVYIKKTTGRPLTVEAFYDGTRFKNYFVKITEDRLLYNNVGAFVGDALTTVFSMPNTKLKPMFQKLSQELAIECPEYRGVVTISALVFDDKILLRYVRFGYDPAAEIAKIALCGRTIVTGSAPIPTGFASVVSLFDIRNENLRVDKIASEKYCIPFMVDMTADGIFTCGEAVAGCIGMGTTIKESFANAYEVVKKVQTKDLCYRPDGGDYAITWWKFSQKTGQMKGGQL